MLPTEETEKKKCDDESDTEGYIMGYIEKVRVSVYITYSIGETIQ